METINILIVEGGDNILIDILESGEDFNVSVKELYKDHIDIFTAGMMEPATSENSLLKEWGAGKDVQMISRTLDADGRTVSAVLVWPDGSGGTYTVTDWNATHECYDGWTKTHTDSGKTVIQAAYTRNTEGVITNKPVLTIV